MLIWSATLDYCYGRSVMTATVILVAHGVEKLEILHDMHWEMCLCHRSFLLHFSASKQAWSLGGMEMEGWEVYSMHHSASIIVVINHCHHG